MSEADVDVEALKAQFEERYRNNAALLGAGDVVVACVPGSGSSLLSTLILELGFQHLDQYFNVLQEDGTAETDPFFRSMRSRLSGYAEVDSGAKEVVDKRVRFYRCHLTPEGFDLGVLHGVVLLVRDPRDAVHSLYQFLGKIAGRMPGAPEETTFEDYLDGPGFNDMRPVRAWTQVYRSWLDVRHRLRRFSVLYFADLKLRPVEAITDLLADLEIPVDHDTILRAVDRSSFEKMRAHEDEATKSMAETDAPDLRWMRRGKVNEWQEWYTPELAKWFSDDVLVRTAADLGFELNGAR